MGSFALTWTRRIAAIILVLVWPFIIIWAINTLFFLGIAYTLKTWFATLALSAIFNSRSITLK